MDLDVTQSFENGPDCGGFTLATHAKYVLAPGLDIEPEICKVYSLEVAGFFCCCFLKRDFSWFVYRMCHLAGGITSLN